MKDKGLEAIVLRRNPNLAWAIAGRAHVPTTIDAACFDLVIMQDSAIAITNVVEAPRLTAEEFPSEISVKTVPWSQGRDPLLPAGLKIGSDQPGGDRVDLGLEIEIIRGSLIAEDVARFKEICSDAAIALGGAMKEVSQADREIDVAGLITIHAKPHTPSDTYHELPFSFGMSVRPAVSYTTIACGVVAR